MCYSINVANLDKMIIVALKFKIQLKLFLKYFILLMYFDASNFFYFEVIFENNLSEIDT